MSKDPASAAADTSVSSTPVRPWGSLAFAGYRLLWISLLFSTLAFQMGRVLNLWQVYEISGSALQLGLTGLFQAAPLIVFGLVGGTVADAVNRKLLLIVSQVLTLALTLVLAILTYLGSIEVWHIYAVTAALTVVNIVDRPARMSLIPAMVPRSHLLNAITLHTTVMQLAMLVGPMVGGFALAGMGIANAYLLMAAIFVPVVIALLILRAPDLPRGERARVDLRAAWEGLRFVWSQQVILALIVMDTAATFFGAYRALMPVFQKDIRRVDEVGLGTLMAAPAFGALLGTVFLLTAGQIRRTGLLVLGATALYAVCLALFGLSVWFPLSVLLAGALGFWDSIGMSVRQTVLQMATPDRLRGRATSILQIFTMGAPSLGFVEAGIAASFLGAPGALLLGATVTGAVVAMVGAGWRQVREFRS